MKPPAPHQMEIVPVGRPTWRKPAGMFLILALIAVWAVLIASQAERIGALPILVQAPIYLFLGLVWIVPLKPLLQWMETGSFRRPRTDG